MCCLSARFQQNNKETATLIEEALYGLKALQRNMENRPRTACQ